DEGVNSLESGVDCVISVPAVPPPLNDSHVVTIDNNALWCLEESVDSSFPSWDEAPGSPMFSDNNADTNL
ncbi:hypothetical protein PAXRUDRAFT_174189, partial [Paxillus rubicundulus Ve08.2h10]